MTVSVRQATREDLPRIWEIRHGVGENRLLDPSIVKDDEVAWYMDNAIFLVSEDNGGVQGFGCANPLIGYVWALFVDPAAHRRGHGQALLDAMCAGMAAAGLIQAHLTTGENTAAAEFYQRQGWRRTGRAFSGEAVFVKRLDIG